MKYDKSVQHSLQKIPDIKTFEDVLNKLTINEEDKTLMRLHYLEGKSFSYIADELSLSESWVKKKHLRILKKISKIL